MSIKSDEMHKGHVELRRLTALRNECATNRNLKSEARSVFEHEIKSFASVLMTPGSVEDYDRLDSLNM